MMQIIANGLLSTSITLMIAFGLLPVVLARRVFHVAQGAVFAIAPYTCIYLVDAYGKAIFPISVLVAFAIGVLVSICIDSFIYAPIVRRGASTLCLFIASLGVFTVAINLISITFGDESRSLQLWGKFYSWDFAGARFTIVHVTTILIAFCGAGFVYFLLKFTQFGRELRAISDDRELALIHGVNAKRVYALAATLAGALAVCAGILSAVDTNSSPEMGLNPILSGLVAVIVGFRQFWGIVLASIVIGFSKHIFILWIPTQWQDAIVFAILILALFAQSQSRGFRGDDLQTIRS